MLCRTVLHGGRLPGGPPVDPLPSDQLKQEASMARRYDEGSAASDVTSDEAEGEAHGWLIARSAHHINMVPHAASASAALRCSADAFRRGLCAAA